MKKNQQDLSHQNYLSVSKEVRLCFTLTFDQKFTIF